MGESVESSILLWMGCVLLNFFFITFLTISPFQNNETTTGLLAHASVHLALHRSSINGYWNGIDSPLADPPGVFCYSDESFGEAFYGLLGNGSRRYDGTACICTLYGYDYGRDWMQSILFEI